MKEIIDSGPVSLSTLIESALPPGFYTLGLVLEATGIPSGSPTPFLRLDVGSPNPYAAAVAVVTASAPKATALIQNVYVEPGQLFTYQVQQFSFGSNPPADWTLKAYLYAAVDVATES